MGPPAKWRCKISGRRFFSLTSGSSLAFGNSLFGTFNSESITKEVNTPGAIAIFVLGEWNAGTQGGFSGDVPRQLHDLLYPDPSRSRQRDLRLVDLLHSPVPSSGEHA